MRLNGFSADSLYKQAIRRKRSRLMLMEFWRDENGTTAVEYGLIVVCLSLVVIGGIMQVQDAVRELFAAPTSKLNQALTD